MKDSNKFIGENPLNKYVDEEMTNYFYRNCFSSFQKLYDYLIDYIRYLEYELKKNNIKFKKRKIEGEKDD